MPCAYRVFTMTRINVIPVQLLSVDKLLDLKDEDSFSGIHSR